MFLRDGKKINIDASFVFGTGSSAIQYPEGSLRRMSQQEREALGVFEVPDPVYPDQRYYWVSENEDGSITSSPKNMVDLRKAEIADIKQIRQQAHDTLVKSAGVSAVYDENLRAARAHLAGQGAAETMRDGTTADAYLTALAVPMGITKEAFAAYIVSENTAGAAKAGEIEAEYNRLVWTVIPAALTPEDLMPIRSAFSVFCQLRTG